MYLYFYLKKYFQNVFTKYGLNKSLKKTKKYAKHEMF